MEKRLCDICKKNKTEYVVCKSCVKEVMTPMTVQKYKEWLEHNLQRIKDGLELIAWDDDTIGNKDMYCSWGMCSDDIAAFPDPETWGYKELTKPNHWDTKRIRTKGKPKGYYCPMDTRISEEEPDNPINGCFWTCAVFQHKLTWREKAIERYEFALKVVEKRSSK